MTPSELKAALRVKARELGFDDCRVAVAAPAAHRELYEQWIAEGKHGEMAWMAKNIERRGDPRLVLEGAILKRRALGHAHGLALVAVGVAARCSFMSTNAAARYSVTSKPVLKVPDFLILSTRA